MLVNCGNAIDIQRRSETVLALTCDLLHAKQSHTEDPCAKFGDRRCSCFWVIAWKRQCD